MGIGIEKPVRLSVADRQMHLTDLTDSQESIIPIDEIARVVISVPTGMITTRLIEQLSANNASLILCDEKHSPACELMPLSKNDNTAGCIMDQVTWSKIQKDDMWAEIIRLKISNQIRALKKCRATVPDALYEYLNNVQSGDKDNREGLAARIYFRALFGNDFIRYAPDDINAALNYAYSLVLSTVSRALVMYGYSTVLGIHHISRSNRFNLSCDLMEPFRPFMDVLVYRHRARSFDKIFKRELIKGLQQRLIYNSRHMTMEDAIASFVLHCTKMLTEGKTNLPEVYFD